MTVTFSAIRYGTTVWELDGLERSPVRFEAHLSAAEDEGLRVVVAFQAVLSTLDCRMRWHGRAEGARA